MNMDSHKLFWFLKHNRQLTSLICKGCFEINDQNSLFTKCLAHSYHNIGLRNLLTSRISTFSVDIQSDDYFGGVLNTLPDLKSVTFNGLEKIVYRRKFNRQGYRFIDIFIAIPYIFNQLLQIKLTHSCSNMYIKSESLNQLIKYCPNLQLFHTVDSIKHRHLKLMIKHTKQLTSIQSSELYLTDLTMENFTISCANLSHISLSNVNGTSERSIQSIIHNCSKSLIHLDASQNRSVTLENVTNLLKTCDKLRFLIATCNTKFVESAAADLKKQYRRVKCTFYSQPPLKPKTYDQFVEQCEAKYGRFKKRLLKNNKTKDEMK